MVDAAANPIIPTIPVAFTSFAVGTASTTPVPGDGDGAGLDAPQHRGDRRPERRRLERHRRIQGRRQEPRRWSSTRTSTRSTAPACSTTPPAPRRSSTSPQQMKNVNPREQAAVHLVRRRGAGPAGLRVLRQQPHVDRAQPHRLRPRRGRDGHAELHDRRPRSGGAGPLRRTCHADVPESGLQGVDGRARPGDRLLRLDRAEPRAVLAGRNRRDQLQRRRHPGQRPADRAGLLQDPGRRSTCSAATSATSRATSRASTAAASTTRSCWCDNLSQQRPGGADVHVEGVRRPWSSRWPSTRR